MVNRRTVKSVTKDLTVVNQVIDTLEDLIRNDFVSISLFSEDIRAVIERLKDNSFKLAVVGEFSSGKSTFINALLGKDILKHGAKETTATITEIQNVRSGEKTDEFDVFFEDDTFKSGIPINKLIEYTSTSSETHAVAEEIEKVVLKSNIIESEYPVSFIDTPGLNGVADNHREKTIEQIKNAHACIYLLQVRGLGQSDVDFIRFISTYQHNFIFVQNFIDELKELEGETAEEKIAEQNKILSEKVFYDIGDVSYKIVGTSARNALIARDHGIKTFDGITVTEEIREKLYNDSLFDDVLDEIAALMSKNVKESTQQKDAISVALNILYSLLDVVSEQNQLEHIEWNESPEARQYRIQERLIKELENKKQENERKITNFAESESDAIRKILNKKIEDGFIEIEESAADVINSQKTIDDLQKYMENRVAPIINQKRTDIEKDCDNYINAAFQNVISDAILRIMEYTGRKSPGNIDNKLQFSLKPEPNRYNSFKQEEDIEWDKKELAQKKADFESSVAEQKRLNDEIPVLDIQIKGKDIESRNALNRKLSEEYKLGSMPETVTRYRTETYTVQKRALLIKWEETKTREVPYVDSLNQQYWQQRKSEIEKQYRLEQNKIDSEKRTLINRLSNYKDEIAQFESNKLSRQNDLESLQLLLDEKIKNAEARKEKVKAEYLRELKNKAISQINGYLYENEDIKGNVIDNYKKTIDECKQSVTKTVLKLFEVSYTEKLNTLKNKLNNGNEDKKTIVTDNAIVIIKDAVKVLEEKICLI